MTGTEKGFRAFLKKILFPDDITCLFCGGEIAGKACLCPDCRARLPYINNACVVCGCAVFSGAVCVRCKNTLPEFDRNYSVCGYDDFVRDIIYRFKNGDRYLYKPLSELICGLLKRSGARFDIVVSVPVTDKVRRQRGYNQSELLAESIGRLCGTEYCGALVKKRETLFQKNCTGKDRRDNVKDAFGITDENAVKDKTALIADDIITTASTLSECALVLKRAGARQVVCATFAAVEPQIKYDGF